MRVSVRAEVVGCVGNPRQPAALAQLRGISRLPWVDRVRVMPDVHLGKGATVDINKSSGGDVDLSLMNGRARLGTVGADGKERNKALKPGATVAVSIPTLPRLS